MSGRTAGLLALVATAALLALSPLASEHPDGLEAGLERAGVTAAASDEVGAPMQDYALPGVEGPLSGPLAGLIGAALVGALALGGAWLTSRGPSETGTPSETRPPEADDQAGGS